MNKSDLHDYQLEAVEHIINNESAGLFLEMGLGKTVSTLTAINFLMYEDLEIDSVLVIAPKRVVESVWAEEGSKWEHLRKLKFSKVIGNERERLAALSKNADVYLISRDNVAWLCGVYGGSMLPFDMLVIDELSSFKNPKSIRFKSLRQVQPSFSRIVGLTGTPSPQGLIDLWSQIYLLDRGERLGKYITRYREKYFRPDKRNGAIIYSHKIIPDGESAIYEKIGDICMSMKAEDYLKMPERIENIIKLELPKKIKESYAEFEKEQVLQLFEDQPMDEAISAVNAAALSNKLLQFSNGAVYDSERRVHEIHKIKLDALKEIIEDANGKPVLVAWSYRHDLERIKEHLSKYDVRELKTNDDIDDWNAGKIQVMVMHPASGGHGLNLQAGGNIIVWFGLTWSLEFEQQFNARLFRQGQKNAVIIHKLVCTGTMDEDVVNAINRKSGNQDRLMDAVKARIKKWQKWQKT